MRRVLNARTGFDLGNLGLLRPVIRICERYDKFWTPAIPDLRMVDHDNCPLYFIPYELKLSERLADCPIAIPFVEQVEQSMQNLQMDARLRIYPPGTGVIRIGLTVQFKELVNISTLSRLASDIENLFFVDPEGNQKPYEDFFLDAIEEVSNTIFVNEGYSYEQRCWMPPVTEYSLKGETTLVPEVEIDNLAQVLYLAPGSEDSLQDLVEHVKGALKSPLWQKNRILAVPTQGIALFILDGGNIRGSEQRGRNILGWLRETREIIMAALYAHKAFTEEIERLYFTQELNDTWLPPTSKFLYLASLLQTMLKVIQAIGSIRLHLHRQGGSMIPFAQDLWLSSNLPDYESCDIGLEYILDWLLKAQSACDSESIDSLISTVRKIQAIPRLFS